MAIDKSDNDEDSGLRVSLRQLEVFVATARSASTRAAADRIARSQSAASAKVMRRDKRLGRGSEEFVRTCVELSSHSPRVMR